MSHMKDGQAKRLVSGVLLIYRLQSIKWLYRNMYNIGGGDQSKWIYSCLLKNSILLFVSFVNYTSTNIMENIWTEVIWLSYCVLQVCVMLCSLENYYWRYTSASELVNMILAFVEGRAHQVEHKMNYLILLICPPFSFSSASYVFSSSSF